jgi:hypothetical protein
MKIKTKVLVGFLKKVRMTGKQSINESVLRFENDGLKISANSSPKQSRVMGWLNKVAFIEYEAIGNVAMNDLENVVKVLERFGEIIIFKKEGSLLNIKGDGKTVDIELVNENFLETDTNEPNLTFTDNFEITSVKLSNIIQDVKMNKDAVLTIKTVEKGVMFSNTGKYKFVNTHESLTCKGGVTVSFGEPFVDCVSELDGNLQISVGSKYPCKVIEKLENSVITIIIAPRVEDSDD